MEDNRYVTCKVDNQIHFKYKVRKYSTPTPFWNSAEIILLKITQIYVKQDISIINDLLKNSNFSEKNKNVIKVSILWKNFIQFFNSEKKYDNFDA